MLVQTSVLHCCSIISVLYTESTFCTFINASLTVILFEYFCIWQFHLIYFASFGLIVIGIVIYAVNPPRPTDKEQEPTTNSDDVSLSTWLSSIDYRNGPLPADMLALIYDVNYKHHTRLWHNTEDQPSCGSWRTWISKFDMMQYYIFLIKLPPCRVIHIVALLRNVTQVCATNTWVMT